MADRPIIFSGPMVRALLSGSKTQTRRVAKVSVIDGTEAVETPYRPGDRLWCRETWGLGCRPCPVHGWVDGIEYKADCTDDDAPPLYAVIPDDVEVDDSPTGWRSPIHMPRWASRLTLIVEEVRVQRLQEISEPDVWAEGLSINPGPPGYAQEEFAALWNSLHGPEAWDANPFVAAITFRVEPRNIDTL